MNICPECNYQNRPGELFCQDCGSPLFNFKRNGADDVASTRHLDVNASPPQADAPLWGGTTSLSTQGELLIHIRDHDQPLTVRPKDELIFGRSDAKNNHYPDIDLSPYGAIEEGISRVHARLRRSGATITLADMNSVNGTFLNGQRLPPNQDRVLHDGDEVTLGRLVMHIYFK
jgi:hypothetical protein